jgi:P4 family phage/plasmid primase-like protien
VSGVNDDSNQDDGSQERENPDNERNAQGDNDAQSENPNATDGRLDAEARFGTETRDLFSAKPFVKSARLWRDAGWIGTVPLPPKAKNPPPTGWTGRNAGFADNKQISEWAKMAQYRKGNIAIHLGFPVTVGDKVFEVIGIDVDHYTDAGKVKSGGDQLIALEEEYGPLPNTYVSTARANGGDYRSGIRFFLVPQGLAFKGQVDKDIEVIQKSHRFAAVWPSYNPKVGGQYFLYAPDEWARATAGGDSHSPESARHIPVPVAADALPRPESLPLLPGPWLDRLTNGRMLDSDGGIDMDSTVDEIEEWAGEQFNDPTDMCYEISETLNKWKDSITSEATSHDKITGAHWELVNLGAEGHTGWLTAIKDVQEHYLADVITREKRGASEVNKEIFRSRTNALRKAKAKVDAISSKGGRYTPKMCVCKQIQAVVDDNGPGGNAGGLYIPDSDDDLSPPDRLNMFRFGRAKSPDEYEMTDDGNAEHLADLLRYKSDCVKFVEGRGWHYWIEGTPERPSHWLFDSKSNMIRAAFRRIQHIQRLFAEMKKNEAQQLWDQMGNLLPYPPQVKAAMAAANKWEKWADRSGMERPAIAAVNCLKMMEGVLLDINELDRSPVLLGVANGVLELDHEGGVYLRDAIPEDFVTLNTKVDYEIYKGIPASDVGKIMWEEYLDQFVPADRRQDYQIMFGHCLIGGNPERLMIVLMGGTSTGKSTMLRALGAAMGDYASTVNTSTIFGEHKLNPALANAIPKRMVFASELSTTDKISVSTLKRATGNDPVRAELKGVNVEVQGVPQFVPIMATNTTPEIPGADKALRRRLVVLPFDNEIPSKKDEKEASRKLEEFASTAILAWLVEGFNLYMKQGLPKNREIELVTDAFASELTLTAHFVGERIRRAAPEEYVSISDAYRAYDAWCSVNGVTKHEALNNVAFGREMSGLGYKSKVKKIGSKAERVYMGVKLTNNARVAGNKSVSLKVTPVGNTDSNNNSQKGN